MDDFLHTVALLRAKHHRPAGFNLFSVLRSSSDEVRLHSRYLSFLLNPKSAHGKGKELLELFLSYVGIEGFDCGNATVLTEYQNIDILVRNPAGQAVIIENKIYAGDQDEQIYRYHTFMQGERCSQIWNLYLTLDGSEPSEQSTKGLDVNLVSYETDIIEWLNACVPLVAREPGVRESIFQYIELLQELTSSDQGEAYMSRLKEQILQGENIFLISDIERAYKEVLTDLQLDLWKRMITYQSQQYPSMPTPKSNATKATIKDYYSKAKNSKYFGFTYPLGFMEGNVYIELNHRLYFGFGCVKAQHPEDYSRLLALVPSGRGGPSSPVWKYPTPNLNLYAPTNQDLTVLKNAEERQLLAQSLIDGAHELWQLALTNYGQKTN